jgi:NADH:ubiquinone oxidoreductase subunit F (NADH-binding)
MSIHHDEPADVGSFYHLAGDVPATRHCQGTACFVARHLSPKVWQAAERESPRVYCLGRCYEVPAVGNKPSRPHVEVRSPLPIVLERVQHGKTDTFDAYRQSGGMAGLKRADGLEPEAIVTEIERSELRGRGGAGFPTGRKWRTVATQTGAPKYVVANLDEGDPGAYLDRIIAEDDPFVLIEGMAIAARAIGAAQGFIYVRAEYPGAIAMLEAALTAARSEGWFDKPSGTNGIAFDIELVVGRGSYICGEETSLLNSIEGRRPMVRVRPPYVAERGLWGRPTLVNNVETFASIPWIMRHGAAAYAALGTPGSRGTKVVSLNSLFQRPGLYEVELGVTVRHIVEALGGGLSSGELRGVMIGGPLAGVIPPYLLDTPLGFTELRAIGASVGHGGVIAFDQRTSIVELVHHVFQFAADESCGECTPCRLGSRHVQHMLATVLEGRVAAVNKQQFRDITTALQDASLCGLGTGLGEFAASVLRYYPEEIASCLKSL